MRTGASTSNQTASSMGTVQRLRSLFGRIPRRQRLSIAAQVLLDEAEICDQQLGILLRALARDEDDGETAASATGPSVRDGDPVERAKLSPRKRETLSHLLMGLSEKEVALRMKLSPATVHEHVKKIYRAMRVHSRGELLSIFLSRSPQERVQSNR